jgi:DNA-directed RNA polymerase specialized sigma24 family protein
MQASAADRTATSGRTPTAEVRGAFRDVHGTRLHGFALLLTLGDRALAARLADGALSEGSAHAAELSHPERAAAWLRRHVLRALGNRPRTGPPARDRRAALEQLHVDSIAYDALASLGVRERAALVASTVEGLDLRDVGAIVDLDGARLERLLRRARSRATSAGARTMSEPPAEDGPLATLIRRIATRAVT